jgi:hypothetical protein
MSNSFEHFESKCIKNVDKDKLMIHKTLNNYHKEIDSLYYDTNRGRRCVLLKLKIKNIIKGIENSSVVVIEDTKNLETVDRYIEKNSYGKYLPILNHGNEIHIKNMPKKYKPVYIIIQISDRWDFNGRFGFIKTLLSYSKKNKSIDKCDDFEEKKMKCLLCHEELREKHYCDMICYYLKHFEKHNNRYFGDWKYQNHNKYCYKCLMNCEDAAHEYERGETEI